MASNFKPKPKGHTTTTSAKQVPQQHKAGGLAAHKVTTTTTAAIPTTSGEKAAAVGKGTALGAAGATKTVVKNSQAPLYILLFCFLIVGIAKIRGAQVDVVRAFFGGVVVAMVLSLVNVWSSKVATAFAGLILVSILMTYGPLILPALSSTAPVTVTPSASAGSNSNPNVFAQASDLYGANYQVLAPGTSGTFGGVTYTQYPATNALNTPAQLDPSTYNNGF